MSNPLKIYPSVLELSKVPTKVCCPEEGCTNVFNSSSNLNLHLAKTHKKGHLLQADDTKKEYHCPETGCVYHDKIFFKNMKLLKQHFLKVHGERCFSCESCEKGFPTESAKKSHVEYCGVVFQCCDCNTSYDCYESLKTHGRRKKHAILEKMAYKSVRSHPHGAVLSHSEDKLVLNKPLLLPKCSKSVTMLITPLAIKKPTSLMHKSQQTEELLRKTTIYERKPQICVETQTIGDYVSKKPSFYDISSDSDESLSRKSIKTQTESVDSKSQSCNTSFSLSDFDFSEEENVERSSSSTQTSVQKAMPLGDFDSSFFNCNSETQTDFMFQDEIFNVCDYYSNMYTQTCEDILLDGLGFNDNHTQTVFDDVVRNVESQTVMVHNRRNLMACRDMASMETQTDMEFKQMLEEINA